MRGTRRCRGRAWRAAGTLLLALAAGGCSGGEPDDEVTAPSFAPVPTTSAEPEAASAPPSAEPSPEPTAEAPELPVAATEQTPEGAVAFTEWWFETLNYATETGDTEALRAASDAGCATCSSYIQEIEDAYVDGGNVSGGLFAVRVEAAGEIGDLGVRVPVFAEVTETQIRSTDGSVVTRYEAESAVITFTALLEQDGWIAGGLAS